MTDTRIRKTDRRTGGYKESLLSVNEADTLRTNRRSTGCADGAACRAPVGFALPANCKAKTDTTKDTAPPRSVRRRHPSPLALTLPAPRGLRRTTDCKSVLTLKSHAVQGLSRPVTTKCPRFRCLEAGSRGQGVDMHSTGSAYAAHTHSSKISGGVVCSAQVAHRWRV